MVFPVSLSYRGGLFCKQTPTLGSSSDNSLSWPPRRELHQAGGVGARDKWILVTAGLVRDRGDGHGKGATWRHSMLHNHLFSRPSASFVDGGWWLVMGELVSL